MTDKLLIIFVKTPIEGQVKTRLAQAIGDKKALEIYRFLLLYTANITSDIACKRKVFYSNHTLPDDMFDSDKFDKTIQVSGGLGQKMKAAFQIAFSQGYQKVIIIGSDCYELTENILQEAFDALEEHDFVIGPAEDGGYYLLGMRQFEPSVFDHKEWSTSSVYPATINDFNQQNFSYYTLPVLNDIDYLEDIPEDLKSRFRI